MPAPAPPSRARLGWALAGVLAVGLLYGQALGFGFVHDDRVLLEGSGRLARLSTLPAALVHDLFWLADGAVRPSPYWRPLVTASYYLDRAVGGGAPWAFHLDNLVVGALVAGALGLRRGALGLLAALVFLVHPMQVEALANITARTDLYAAALGTLAVFARGPAGALLTLAALGCKETAVVVPAIALLGAGTAGRRAWLPHLGALAAWALVRTALVASWGVAAADLGGPSLASVLQAPGVVAAYLGRLVWPLGSTVARLPPDPGPGLVVLGLVLLGGLGLALHRAPPPLRRELGLVVLPLVPVSGLLTSPVRYAEGFLCWPLLGLALLSLRLGRAAAPRARLVLAPLLLGWTLLSLGRIGDWRDPAALWSAAHAAHPDDPRAALGWARVLAERDPAAALPLAEQAAAAEPDPRKAREGAALVARLLLAQGREDAALVALAAAAPVAGLDDLEGQWARVARCVRGAAVQDPVALEAVCGVALAGAPADPDLWNAAGIVATRRSDYRAAADRFARAAALAPDRRAFRENADRAAALAGTGPGSGR